MTTNFGRLLERLATRRKLLLLTLFAAGFGWLSVPGGLRWSRGLTLTSLEGLPLSTLSGGSLSLVELAAGKPTIVNLWASWCPPCRREMPLLGDAQKHESGIAFVFANQGEGALTVQAYLDSERLELANALLDPSKSLGQKAGSSALPVTLFFAADGQLTYSHWGGISAVSLREQLGKLRPVRSVGR